MCVSIQFVVNDIRNTIINSFVSVPKKEILLQLPWPLCFDNRLNRMSFSKNIKHYRVLVHNSQRWVNYRIMVFFKICFRISEIQLMAWKKTLFEDFSKLDEFVPKFSCLIIFLGWVFLNPFQYNILDFNQFRKGVSPKLAVLKLVQ